MLIMLIVIIEVFSSQKIIKLL